MSSDNLSTRAALRANEDFTYISAIASVFLFTGLSATIWPPLAAAVSVFLSMHMAYSLFHRV